MSQAAAAMAYNVMYNEAAPKMKRRRINKTALHREVGLLERALATFTVRLQQISSYDWAT